MLELLKRTLGNSAMAFSNFSKHLMLSQLLTSTKTNTGEHRVALGNNGTLLSSATHLGATEQNVLLKTYGHNPPSITNTTGLIWTAINNWPTSITEVYILNALSNDVLLTGKLDNPHEMLAGNIFNLEALSWEAAIV